MSTSSYGDAEIASIRSVSVESAPAAPRLLGAEPLGEAGADEAGADYELTRHRRIPSVPDEPFPAPSAPEWRRSQRHPGGDGYS